jgi:endonuclease/exonuclease/phosphatase family metal-dependent hydrolase
MTGSRAEGRPVLRIATLNTWGTRGDWPARRSLLAAEFSRLSPDLITLQETIHTDGYDQVREILAAEYRVVHSATREPDGQGISTASRWPIGTVDELDLHVTGRTHDFACTALATEILAPEPFGRIWLVNHFPDYQLDHAAERELQAVVVARAFEGRPGHVVVAGDLDADPAATSIRFWTGRHALEGLSVCYRDAWEAGHASGPGDTYVPENRYSADWDWPFRRIDYILVRCGGHGGPTLAVERCDRAFDRPDNTVSDHYGLVADLTPPRGNE